MIKIEIMTVTLFSMMFLLIWYRKHLRHKNAAHDIGRRLSPRSFNVATRPVA
jgi:hypothetical protein